MKRIGVLTSGGDAPGMNACIRAIHRASASLGLDLIGVRKGYAGLIAGEVQPISRSDVVNIIHLGGTILETSRSERFKVPEGRAEAADIVQKAGLEGLILIGGDGTFRGGTLFYQETGIPVIGIPGTIDNDIYGTDFSIGFDTAVNVALESIDRIRDTAISHGRLFFVEVMGHASAFIATESGIAGGAESILLPEEDDPASLIRFLGTAFREGKHHAIVVVAEGARPGRSFRIAEEVSSELDIEAKVCVLGHTQRGGSPTARDRILAAKLGVSAVHALYNGVSGMMAGEIRNEVVFTPLYEIIGRKNRVNDGITSLMRLLSG